MSKKKLTPVKTMSSRPMVGPMRMDGWFSAMTGIGGMMSDKRQYASFQADFTNFIENAELWRGNDLGARIVETIPNEMTRQGWELSLEGEAGRIKDKMKDITAFAEDLDIVNVLWRALCYERAYGGAAILLGCNDLQEMAKPLDEDGIKSLNWIEVYEPVEMHALQWQNDPNLKHFGQPETFRFAPIAVGGSKVQGVEIHRSRMIIFSGIKVSRRLIGTLPGWGDAVLTRCRGVLRDFQTSWDATGILISEFAQAVLKIKGLAELIALGKDEELKNRIRAIELSRSVAHAVVIDADAEEFERKQTPVNGLAELLDKFGTRLAASADMPLTLLMGTSPGGMNATGESDIRGFYDRVKAMQVRKLKPAIERIYRIIMRVLDIEEPDSWGIKFHPLWQPTEAEMVNTRWIQTQMDEKNITNSVLESQEVRRARFGGAEYSYETPVDPDVIPPPKLPPATALPFGKKPTPPPTSASGDKGPAPNGASPDEDMPGGKQRMDEIIQDKDGYHVFSTDGKKHLGGPYATKALAEKRLAQVEYFKQDRTEFEREDGTTDWGGYYQHLISQPHVLPVSLPRVAKRKRAS